MSGIQYAEQSFENLRSSYQILIKKAIDGSHFPTADDLHSTAISIFNATPLDQIPLLAAVQELYADWDCYVREKDATAFKKLIIDTLEEWAISRLHLKQNKPDEFQAEWKEQFDRTKPKEVAPQPILSAFIAKKPKPISDEQQQQLELLSTSDYTYVSYATKPEELELCITIGMRLFNIIKMREAGTFDSEQVEDAKTDFCRIVNQELGIENFSQDDIDLLGIDIALWYNNALRIFNASAITIAKFKSYPSNVQANLLSAPDIALFAIDKLDSDAFDKYMRLYCNSGDLQKIFDMDEDDSKEIIKQTNASIKEHVATIKFSDDVEVLINTLEKLLDIYNKVIFPFNLSGDLFSSKNWQALRRMRKSVKELELISSANEGGIEFLLDLEFSVLEKTLEMAENIAICCRELNIKPVDFLTRTPGLNLNYWLHSEGLLMSLVPLVKYYNIQLQELIGMPEGRLNGLIVNPNMAIEMFNRRAKKPNCVALEVVLYDYVRAQQTVLSQFEQHKETLFYFRKMLDNLEGFNQKLLGLNLEFYQYRTIIERAIEQVRQYITVYLHPYLNPQQPELKFSVEFIHFNARFDSNASTLLHEIFAKLQTALRASLAARCFDKDEDYTDFKQHPTQSFFVKPEALKARHLRYYRQAQNNFNKQKQDEFADIIDELTNRPLGKWFASLYSPYGEDDVNKAIFNDELDTLKDILTDTEESAVNYNFKNFTYLATALYGTSNRITRYLIEQITEDTRDDFREFVLSNGFNMLEIKTKDSIMAVTALNLAIKAGNLRVVQALLVRGANPTLADNNGLTPIEAAKLSESEYKNVIMNDLLIAIEYRIVPEIQPAVHATHHVRARSMLS